MMTDEIQDEAADIRAIADHVVALAKAGDFDAIGETYWDDDVISFEAAESPMAVCDGIEAVRAKTAWWSSAHEVHGGDAQGPWVNGDQFTVRFTMDVTVKATGERIPMDEIALYTIDDGLIIEERFF
ncbi:nuclear transport factor 2 family protein, partial [Sandarakinorhabdus sp.]|uniref:nuclear transport factor 2 family protein n=1 Tax=Sandarakinorhabdus sp. TaxID=1916663 RepID=UPI00333F31A4